MAQEPVVFVQDGESIPYRPSSAVTAGQVVVVNGKVYIAHGDIAAGELGNLRPLTPTPIYRWPKDANACEAGEDLYWHATGNPVVGESGTGAVNATSDGGVYIGKAHEDADAGDATVKIEVHAASTVSITPLAGSVTADDITGSDSTLTISGKAGVGSGTAGAVAITSGASAGATGTAGPLTIDAGAATGGTAGAVTIGGTNAATVTIGKAEGAIAVAGTAAFAKMFVLPVNEDVAANGSAQANAAALVTGVTLVTGADGAAGVKLPAAAPGLVCIVKNDETANAALKVYPDTDDAVNALAANASLEMPAKTAAAFIACDATTWYSIPRVPS